MAKWTCIYRSCHLATRSELWSLQVFLLTIHYKSLCLKASAKPMGFQYLKCAHVKLHLGLNSTSFSNVRRISCSITNLCTWLQLYEGNWSSNTRNSLNWSFCKTVSCYLLAKKLAVAFKDSPSLISILGILKKPLRQHVDQDVTVKFSTETN